MVGFDTGKTIGYGRVAGRYIASILSALCILIGYLWMLWDTEKQTWHDKLSNSVVVPAADYPVRNA
ncbi:MAG: RDD family protein [Actinomycetota bacterium]|nr:RDD family protein [Actinomycetota bacterium]